MSTSQRRCKNCSEPIVHDTYDWVHWDGYYMCGDEHEGKYAE
jgi:hypothetical protein